MSCKRITWLILLSFVLALRTTGATVTLYLPTNAAPRVEFGAARLIEALKTVHLDAVIEHKTPPEISQQLAASASGKAEGQKIFFIQAPSPAGKESFVLNAFSHGSATVVSGNDDSGILYGCLEFAQRIRDGGKLPEELNVHDGPVMKLRGTCVGMQKTYILPGRKVYEYPYTPDLFPWFYDKGMWREYLDSLVANRMNTLYLWNGHPFSSLVKLPDYPEAVEVSPEIFKQNVEMFHWLTAECDRRGIWLVQMFYNIFLPKPLADKNGVATQLAAPTPLASDYTRKSIAEFVKQYPNVGLMVCLGEALQGTDNQINWATNTILPGVLDGMKAAGLTEQPPVVIRTHAMNPEAIIPECFKVYTNLFTETKYNGESLTTYEPRGKAQATHLAMAKLGPHLVNVHILANLEPFRYGAPRFIQKSMQASRERLGASGLHLYPLAYWNWPYAPDIASPALKQWDRDWMWFEAWGRYAWNPDAPAAEDRAYWLRRIGEFYGCDTNAAGKILDAYNDSGEVAPMLIRRFGITEGNRQTLSLGMTLDELVNPKKYGAIPELWQSQAPPGERLDEFVSNELSGQPHVGETPGSVTADCARFAAAAQKAAAEAASSVTRNRDEFARFTNDLHCIAMMADYYALKVGAAGLVLRQKVTQDPELYESAGHAMESSLAVFTQLTAATKGTYRFANSMQTGHRKIPFNGAANGVGTNYHWSQVLPLYEKELADFKAQGPGVTSTAAMDSPNTNTPSAWPAATFKLLSTNAETYEVKVGARPYTDRKYTLKELAPELSGQTGIRFSHETAKSGKYQPIEFEASEPVRVLVGYFQNDRDIWLQVPNLDVASQADERGGVDVLLRNAAVMDECPTVNVHAFRFGAGRNRLELIGKGSFVVLGVVPQSAKLEKRDANLGQK